MEHGTWNMEPGTWNMEPGTWNPEPGTRNMEHGTRKSLFSPFEAKEAVQALRRLNVILIWKEKTKILGNLLPLQEQHCF
jgi:hypothetical protein